MTDNSTPAPIVVRASPVPAGVWQTVRAVAIAVFSMLAMQVFSNMMVAGYWVAAFASAVTAAPAIWAWAYGLAKTLRNERDKRRMADHLPDRIAQVQS